MSKMAEGLDHIVVINGRARYRVRHPSDFTEATKHGEKVEIIHISKFGLPKDRERLLQLPEYGQPGRLRITQEKIDAAKQKELRKQIKIRRQGPPERRK